MDFYDIESETCSFDEPFARRLGFRRIFAINKDVGAAGSNGISTKGAWNSIAFGRDVNQLISLVRNGATAVAITDSYIDKRLIDVIKEQECILCMPMSFITASCGVERSRNIYKMGKLFGYARKQGIDVCFASMAKTRTYMNSYMQLIELAKLIGADERYARHCISDITMRVVGK